MHFWYSLKNAQKMGVNGGNFINFKPKVQEIMNFE